jgi:hypothetical protein
MKKINLSLPWAGLLLALVFLAAACTTTPPPPTQDDLDQMNAAMKRMAAGKRAATDVRGNYHFPDDWNKGQAEETLGNNAPKDTAVGVKSATVSFTAAAEVYEDIAQKAVPLFEKELEDLRAMLADEKARADKAQKDAQAVNAQTYFPDDWEQALAMYQSGVDSPASTYAELKAAVGNFGNAADSFDAMAEKSRPLLAQDKLKEAIARAEEARQKAQEAEGPTNFPNEWKNAETKYSQAQNAQEAEDQDIAAVTALFNQAADAYDDVAKKSAQKTAKEMEDNMKALNAAIARLEKSRKAATDAKAQTNFPNEWKAAETKNTAATGAKRDTVAEIKAAVPLYTSAADAYDDIAKKSAALVKETEESQKALNAAIARLDKSRKAAVAANVQASFPNEWKAAETKNTAATGAKRGTAAEIKAAVTLYNQAADAYDDIVKKNASGSVDTAQTAKTRAEKERQAALDVKADVASANDFSAADKLFQQAAKDFAAKSYGPAADNYNKSATQFAAAAADANKKRGLANDAIEKAKQKGEESAAFAVDTGHALEGKQ